MTKKARHTALLQHSEMIAGLQRENEELKARLAQRDRDARTRPAAPATEAGTAPLAPETDAVARPAPPATPADSLAPAVDAFTICDLQLTVLDIDEPALRYLGTGLRREDAIGRDLASLGVDEERCELYRKVAETGERYTAEQSLQMPGADEAHVITRAFRVGDRLAILNSDVTVQRKYQQALRESEERFRMLAENASDVIWTTDMDLTYTYNSPSKLRQSGYTPEEFQGRTVAQVLTPESLQLAARVFQEELAIEQLPDKDLHRQRVIELAEYHKDGSLVWTEATASFLRDKNNMAVGVIGISRDITERKRAEEALRKSEERFRVITENMLDAVALLDRDGIIRYASPSHERLVGYRPEELVGRASLDLTHPDDVSGVVAALQGIEERGAIGFQYRFRHRDGHYIWGEGSASALRDNTGSVTGFVVASHEITDRKRMEQVMQRQRELAHQLSSASDLQQGLRVCLEAAMEATGLDSGGVYLLDKSSGELRLMVHAGLSDEFVRSTSGYKPDSPGARLVSAGSPIYTRHQTLGVPMDSVREREGLKALAVVPFLHEGRAIGCLNLASHTAEDVPQSAREPLEMICLEIGGAVARLQAEALLRESEERYRLLVDNANEGILVAQDGKIRFANPEFAELVGCTVAEVVSMPFLELIHPDDRQMISDNHARRLRGEDLPHRYPFRLLDKAGNGKWAEINAVLLTWEGRPAVLAMVNDISERRQAEERIRVLSAVVEQSTEGMAVVGLDGTVRFANEAWCRMHGYGGADEVAGRNLSIFHTEEQREHQVEPFTREAMELGAWSGEVGHVTRDGRPFPTLMSAVMLKDDDGQPYALAIVAIDITELKTAQEALAASEAKYRSFFNQVLVGMEVVDAATGRIVLANGEAARMFGFQSPAAMIGVAPMDYILPEDKPWVGRQWADVLADPERHDVSTAKARTQDGRTIWVTASASSFEYEGRPSSLVWILDTTAAREARMKLDEREEQYRLLVENATDAIAVIQDGVLKYVNPKLLGLSGYTAGDLVSRPFAALVHPDDRERAADLHARRMRGEAVPSTYELRTVTSDGRTQLAELTVAMFDWEGRPAVLAFMHDITERRRVEEEARQRTEELDEFFNVAPDFMCIADTDGRFHLLNATWERTLGYTTEELMAAPLVDFIHPDDVKATVAAMARLASGQEIVAFVNRYRCRDDSYRWLEWRATPAGNMIYAAATDITGRKRAEEDLRHQEALFRTLTEDSSDIVVLVGLDGKIQYESPAVQRVLGLTPEERIGSSMFERLHPDDLPAVTDLFQKQTQVTGKDAPALVSEIRLRHQDGSWRTMEAVGRVIARDSASRAIMVNLHDITERKRMQEEILKAHAELEARVEQRTAELKEANELLVREVRERQQAQKRLQESETRYRELVENANSIILELDAGGRITFFNRFAQEFYGLPDSEVLGRQVVGTIAPAVDSTGKDLGPELADMVTHPDKHPALETEGVRRNGERVWISWTNKGLRDADGRLRNILCIGMDRTEQRAIAEMLSEQLREKAASQERQRLARDLHDAVAQTLFSASLIADVLPRLWQRDRDEADRRLEELRRLNRGALAEMRMLLLEMRPAALAAVPLPDLLRHLVEAATAQAKIEVSLEMRGKPGAPPDVQVALYRVAQEALNNVVRHSGATGAGVSLNCRKNSVDLTISDNGTGFDLTSVSPKSLGLRIMHERVESVGATLEIDSRPAGGTRVRASWADTGRKP